MRDGSKFWLKEGVWLWMAAVLWVVPVLVITVMVVTRPLKRTVTPLYHESVDRWLQRRPLYDGPAGMNYTPAFVPLFMPYHAPPLQVGDTLWRWTAAAGIAWGLWALTGGEARRQRAFALVTMLGLPLGLAALRNGQANAHLGASLLMAAVFLGRRWWWPATLCLALACAIKPLGVAAAGLAWLAFPHLRWRLPLGVAAALAAPGLVASPGYVLSQYADCLRNLRECSEVTEHRFADLNGLLRTLGIPLAGGWALLVRAGSGLALAAVALMRLPALAEPLRSLVWLGLGACYLMLFNPMTEANSYVILGPPLALWTRYFFLAGRTAQGWVLAIALVTMSVMPTVLRPWLGNAFALAWHPAMAMVFLTLLLIDLFRPGASTDCRGQVTPTLTPSSSIRAA